MTSQTDKEEITTRVLLDISRIKAIKFSQLIEYNMRNIFLEKSFAKCGGEAIT